MLTYRCLEKIGIKMNGVFFHIFKTAGTSQISVIKKYNHLKVCDIYDPKLNINYHNYFKWTFIRNPFDRLVSVVGAWNWKNIHKSLSQILDLAELGTMMKWELPIPTKEVRQTDLYQNTDMAIMQHIIPMSTVLDRIKKLNNTNVDYIGRFENIDDDWNYIKDKINISDDLPKLNSSKHYPYQKYFNRQKFIDRAADLYKEDFINFNYSTSIG